MLTDQEHDRVEPSAGAAPAHAADRTTDPERDETAAALQAQAEDYAAVSRQLASRGDSRLAALAAWAADLSAVQGLLWDSGIGAAEDPSEPLLAVTGAVDTALSGRVGDGPAVSVRDVVESAREALLGAFDHSVHEDLRKRFCSLDHLDHVRPPEPGVANRGVTARLDGRGGEELVGDLLTASADCRAVSRALAAAEDEEESGRQAVLGDLAGLEAYLVLSSAAAGDATLATTELRWTLAGRRLAGPEEPDGETPRGDGEPGRADLMGDPRRAREAMLTAVLPAERGALRSLLDGRADETVPTR